MTSLKTIRQCLATFDANQMRPGRNRLWDRNETLLILTFAVIPIFAARSAAHPVVLYDAHGTQRIGPHSFPGLPSGDKAVIFAVLDSNDPIASPTISVEAVQGGTTLTLGPAGPLFPIFEGYHVYYKYIDFDPALTGPWQITAIDSEGIGPTAFTDAIADPQFLPLVEDIAVQVTPLGATVSWALPNLAGFDVDGIHFRVIEATSGRHIWNWTDDLLPLQTPSFTAPPGAMQVGVDYVYWVALVDKEGNVEETASLAFSQPFRFTVPGDFNGDGAVDAADLNQWQVDFAENDDSDADNDGDSDGADFLAWQRQLGAAMAGVQSSSTVPEPASVSLAMALAALVARRPRNSASG